ncbi:MAG: Fur family transcriptional regulator [Bacteroidota bacterium]
MSTQDNFQAARKAFTDYLEQHGHRRTAERFTVLEEIYLLDDHFDVESLYVSMKNKGHRISRATLYNTIELLLECDLITRHQFGKNLALFERSYAYKQHDHLICQDCERIFEFCDPRIQQIQSMMGEILRFDVSSHALHLFGHCRELKEKGVCSHNNKATENQAAN